MTFMGSQQFGLTAACKWNSLEMVLVLEGKGLYHKMKQDRTHTYQVQLGEVVETVEESRVSA